MRWPRPRFTLRRLMIAVAILAVCFGAIAWVVKMRTASQSYSRRAWEIEWMSRRAGSLIQTDDGRWINLFDDENDYASDAWAWRLAATCRRLSYYPWLDAGTDPPPPQRVPQPRRAIDLPAKDVSDLSRLEAMRPPAWTFLWTWPWR